MVAAGDLPRGSVTLRLVAITAAVLAVLQLGLPLLRSDVATIAIVADPTEATAAGMDAIALAETAEGFARPLDTQLALGAALLLAEHLAGKEKTASSAGTLRTDTVLFGVMLLVIMVLLGLLSFLPALALGPVAEYLRMVF